MPGGHSLSIFFFFTGVFFFFFVIRWYSFIISAMFFYGYCNVSLVHLRLKHRENVFFRLG